MFEHPDLFARFLDDIFENVGAENHAPTFTALVEWLEPEDFGGVPPAFRWSAGPIEFWDSWDEEPSGDVNAIP